MMTFVMRPVYIWSLLLLALVACSSATTTDPAVTLQPSQIAANLRPDSTPTATEPPQAILLERAASPVVETSPAAAQTAPTEIAVPLPTSIAPELQAMSDNSTLLLTMEMDTACFLAEDFIPFRLIVRSLELEPIYFYRNGRWMMSINNSPVGPQLTSRVPTLRDEFVNLPPNETYVQEEEDLGLWVLSLGPDTITLASPTGIGLPPGDYWVTFIYNNDQDGLTQQPDGSYLIDRAAWRGTIVAPEVRFKVVNDLSQC